MFWKFIQWGENSGLYFRGKRLWGGVYRVRDVVAGVGLLNRSAREGCSLGDGNTELGDCT